MGSGPIDPKELLKGLDCFLGRDGEVKTMDGISKIFSLMKDSQKMVSRCIYLNILLQTRAQDILNKFIRIGGYKLLNTWLTGSKATNNVPFLQQLLLTLQHLPLTVDHLKQNNTAKLVKQLSKSSDDEELRRLASILVSDWMGVIRSQSSSQPTERDKKKRKEENKSKTPVPEKPQEAKNEAKSEEMPEKKREKPKSLRTTAPSHAKFRSTGLELETPSLAPVKKPNSSSSDKYNLKPVPVKRQRQYVAQANSWSLEELCLEVNVTTTQNAVLDACSFGVTGLKLQGATCSNNKLSLSNAISTVLPITQLRWIKQTNADKKANVIDKKERHPEMLFSAVQVTLPVYLNFTRADLIFTVDFEIATKEDPRSFYERGVAVLCTE